MTVQSAQALRELTRRQNSHGNGLADELTGGEGWECVVAKEKQNVVTRSRVKGGAPHQAGRSATPLIRGLRSHFVYRRASVGMGKS
jgi:hypothetical protein